MKTTNDDCLARDTLEFVQIAKKAGVDAKESVENTCTEEQSQGSLNNYNRKEILTGPKDHGGETRAINESVAAPTVSEETDSDVRHYGDHVLGLAAALSEVSEYDEEHGEEEQVLSDTASAQGQGRVGRELGISPRPLSPATQSSNSRFRDMMQGITGYIDKASASLKESISDVLQLLKEDLKRGEVQTNCQLQRVQTDGLRKTYSMLPRNQDGLIDQAAIDKVKLRLAEVNEKCRDIVGKAFQDRCSLAERRVRDMIEEVVAAFDSHLEHTAAAAKHHFRWIKRRYRERVDVNRVAAATELKDTILLNRCILDEVKRELRLENDEAVDKLEIKFQLERSSLRKQRRELEQSLEVLQLEKLRAEQEVAQAQRYIEALEEETEAAAAHAADHSEDGSLTGNRSYRQTRRALASGPAGAGGSCSRPESRGTTPRHHRGSGQRPRRGSRGHALPGARNMVPSMSTNSGSARDNSGLAGASATNSARQGKAGSVNGTNPGGCYTNAPCFSGRGSARGSARGSPSCSARGPGSGHISPVAYIAGGILSDQYTTRDDGAQDSSRGRGSGVWEAEAAESFSSGRHEDDGRMGLEESVAPKLVHVLEKKRLDDLKEELADEAMNREATQARLEMLEQVVPKLQEDLKKAKEQLIQSRMEVNTLRKINTELSGGLDNPAAGVGAEHGDATDRAAAYLLGGKEATAPARSAEVVSGVRKVKGRLRENQSRRNMGSRSPTSDLQNVDPMISRMAWESGHDIVQQQLLEANERGIAFGDGADWQGARNAFEKAGDHEKEDSARGVFGDYETVLSRIQQEVEELRIEKEIAIQEATQLRDEAEAKEQALLHEEEVVTAQGPVTPRRHAALRLDFAATKLAKRELESKIREIEVTCEENLYLRRRLEAIERTALKLNVGGSGGQTSQTRPVDLNDRAWRESDETRSTEIQRLRDTIDALQADKNSMTEGVKGENVDTSVDELTRLPQSGAQETAATMEERIASLESRHREVVARMTEELNKLRQLKATFDDLVEGSVHGSESDERGEGSTSTIGRDGGVGGVGGGLEAKWKERLSQLQHYVKWRLNEAEAQARRERAEMGLKARSHEILLGEMTVLTKEQRLELVRLHDANKRLREQLAERSSQRPQPGSPTCHSPPASGEMGHREGIEGWRGIPPTADPGRRTRGDQLCTGAGDDPENQLVTPLPSLPKTNVPLVPVHSLQDKSLPATVAKVGVSMAPRRPRTSTGYERGDGRHPPEAIPQAIIPEAVPEPRLGKRIRTNKPGRRQNHVKASRLGVETMARRVQSRVWKEFLGAQEGTCTARKGHNNSRKPGGVVAVRCTSRREAMVMGRPLSAVTGSIRTNVPVPGAGWDARRTFGRTERRATSGLGLCGTAGKGSSESRGSTLW